MTSEEAIHEYHDARQAEDAIAAAAAKKSRRRQIARDFCAIVALVAFVLGIVNQHEQNLEQRVTAAQSKCINAQLGDRSGLLISLISELTTESSAQSKALKILLSSPTHAAATAAAEAFEVASDKFAADSATLAQTATDHPLGRC